MSETKKSQRSVRDLLKVQIDNQGVATVLMNNADKHNAFDDQIIKALTDTFADLNKDQAVRVVVLAGAGKSFSAGGDLAWMQRMADYSYEQNLADSHALALLMQTLYGMQKPTIARVHGAAYGGAVGLVSCCDFAIASPRASFCLSEVKVGLIPATIGPYVVAAIGARAARRYFQSAERFSADEALRLGLVTHLAAEDQLDGDISALVKQLIHNSPQAMRQAKQLVADLSNRPIDQAQIDKTCELIAKIRVSPEGQEGLKAFLEKRAPKWSTKVGKLKN